MTCILAQGDTSHRSTAQIPATQPASKVPGALLNDPTEDREHTGV